MTPSTRRELIALRQITARIGKHKGDLAAAKRSGARTEADHLEPMIARLEAEAMLMLAALERSGALIAIEALVSTATSYAQTGEKAHG